MNLCVRRRLCAAHTRRARFRVKKAQEVQVCVCVSTCGRAPGRVPGRVRVRARAGAPAFSQHLEAVLHLDPEKALGQGLHLFYNIYNIYIHYYTILHIFLYYILFETFARASACSKTHCNHAERPSPHIPCCDSGRRIFWVRCAQAAFKTSRRLRVIARSRVSPALPLTVNRPFCNIYNHLHDIFVGVGYIFVTAAADSRRT